MASLSLSRIGEGNGNPLQCSCLENPRDGGAWWAAICGVTQSQTRLKQLSSSSKPLLMGQNPYLVEMSILDVVKKKNKKCCILSSLGFGLGLGFGLALGLGLRLGLLLALGLGLG